MCRCVSPVQSENNTRGRLARFGLFRVLTNETNQRPAVVECVVVRVNVVGACVLICLHRRSLASNSPDVGCLGPTEKGSVNNNKGRKWVVDWATRGRLATIFIRE